MELKVELSQKQTLSQHMVQSMEILQMSAQELESYMETLSLENPVLEPEDVSGYVPDTRQEDLRRKLDWLESTDIQNKVYYQQEREIGESREEWYGKDGAEEGLPGYLLSQLIISKYSDRDREVLEFMLQSLDSRGYLMEELSFISRRFSISLEHAQKLLEEIQSLDPAGVGARDWKECLLLQLKRRGSRTPYLAQPLAETLVVSYMEEIAKNHLHEIAKKLGVSIEEIASACEEIRSLNPKPGSVFSSREQLSYISPDVVVVKLADEFEILINEYQYPHFSISEYYRNMQKSTTDKETGEYLQKKMQQAEWVFQCISQRSATLLRVMSVLVEKQHDFFLYGTGNKVPMRLLDIAEELDLHSSTISRALRGKYLQCTWGVFPLNYFLTSAAAKTAGQEEKAPEQVKNLIQKVIDGEGKKKPCSDQAISDRLKEYGLEVSRRTVNKYRQEMNLPDKSGRKQWKN